VSFASFAVTLCFFFFPHRVAAKSLNVQHGLAGEVAVDQPAGDRADLVP
jgi:hypothetical protein